MQGCIASLVLIFEVRFHREHVRKRKFTAGEACPMQRSAASMVCIVDIHPLDLSEVVERGWLITLRRNMEHISPVYIPTVNVGTMLLNQLNNKLETAMVCCKVECGEVLICWLVYPVGHLLFRKQGSILW